MIRRFTLSALAIATAAFTVGGMAHAADADSATSRSDTRFLQRAAQSGKLEIEASQLAAQRAQSQEVKDFAQKMVTDHQAVDKELRALAQSKKVELPADLRWGQNRTLKSLQDREGHEFDERYVSRVAVDAHEDAVELFENAAQDADDAQVKAFAAKVLPDLKAHLSMAEQLQESMRASRANAAPMDRPAPAGAVPPAPGTGGGAPAPASPNGMSTTPGTPAAPAASGTNR